MTSILYENVKTLQDRSESTVSGLKCVYCWITCYYGFTLNLIANRRVLFRRRFFHQFAQSYSNPELRPSRYFNTCLINMENIKFLTLNLRIGVERTHTRAHNARNLILSLPKIGVTGNTCDERMFNILRFVFSLRYI